MKPWKKMVDFLCKDVRFQNEPKRVFLLLRCLYLIIAVYFLVVFLIEAFVFQWRTPLTSLGLLMILIPAFAMTYRFTARVNVCAFFCVVFVWMVAFLMDYGWNCGVQHFLFGLMALYFFAGDGKKWKRVAVLCFLFFLRLLLFTLFLNRTPLVALDTTEEFILQTLSSLVAFIVLAMVCGFYSSGIDSAEKKLILYNEELKKEASTDPLTGLPNRRGMIKCLEREINSGGWFTVALGDIDFFKIVNDQWGHNEGDEVLVRLADLFMREMRDSGMVCRWGGEEFLFLFRGMNGDDANVIVMRICDEIRRMEFGKEGQRFKLTMTFGVEEYDFRATLTELIRVVDQKLYQGKENGRNCVIY